MDKINKPDVDTIPSLALLDSYWQTWGTEYKLHLDSNKTQGIGFSWRRGIYENLRTELSILTNGHCSFCDGYPFDMSKETIEHYRPKNEFPLEAYDWYNLFYCCDSCQKEANRHSFLETIKPDHYAYSFDSLFYVDLDDFRIKVLENLENTNLPLYNKATNFLERYGINIKHRRIRRKNIYRDLRLFFKGEHGKTNSRTRTDFPFRYMYDLVSTL